MTRTLEPEHESRQADFERRLFESARGDSPPPGATERAWVTFAAAAGTLTPLAAAPAPGLLRRWFGGSRAQALRWTLIGALGGGSLVAVWLRPAPPLRSPPLVAAPAPVAPQPGALTPPPVVAPSVSPAAARGSDALPADVPRRSVRASSKTSAGGAVRESSPAESLLAREVAALDAARSALAVGANASALRQIEQYHRDFPAGELSAEADVLAIEALAAAGERTASRRAAQRFLERHPHDPHVARVRELAL